MFKNTLEKENPNDKIYIKKFTTNTNITIFFIPLILQKYSSIITPVLTNNIITVLVIISQIAIKPEKLSLHEFSCFSDNELN